MPIGEVLVLARQNPGLCNDHVYLYEPYTCVVRSVTGSSPILYKKQEDAFILKRFSDILSFRKPFVKIHLKVPYIHTQYLSHRYHLHHELELVSSISSPIST